MNIQKIFSICFFYALSTTSCIAMEPREVRLPDPVNFLPGESYTSAVAINPVRPEVAAVSTNGKVVIWNLNTCTVAQVFEAPEKVTDNVSIRGLQTGETRARIGYYPNGNFLSAHQPYGPNIYNLEPALWTNTVNSAETPSYDHLKWDKIPWDTWTQMDTHPIRQVSPHVKATALYAGHTSDRKKLIQLIALAKERYILVTDE
jgi:hypothetical protein